MRIRYAHQFLCIAYGVAADADARPLASLVFEPNRLSASCRMRTCCTEWVNVLPVARCDIPKNSIPWRAQSNIGKASAIRQYGLRLIRWVPWEIESLNRARPLRLPVDRAISNCASGVMARKETEYLTVRLTQCRGQAGITGLRTPKDRAGAECLNRIAGRTNRMGCGLVHTLVLILVG